ncbi:MAG: molybdate ABC transporter substrate-binding protein [Magnetococcales bacterium]|nr:molybdate ABC transporter substrate-binding protein [Magnetococcales bacterium]
MHPVRADVVSVAVAANFSTPMKVIVAEFARDTGHQAEPSFGATGKLHTQIVHGAPFEMLLAADDVTCGKLVQAGLAMEQTRRTYAVGRLVLWSSRPGFVDDRGEILKSGDFRHLALAAPRLAPYGAAAIETLTALGLVDKLQSRFVQGENIAQAYQFITSGNAELGFVALSQVMVDGGIREGSAWIVPEASHRPLRQEAVILKRGENRPAALAFLDYLTGPRAQTVLQAFGYRLETR